MVCCVSVIITFIFIAWLRDCFVIAIEPFQNKNLPGDRQERPCTYRGFTAVEKMCNNILD